MKKIIYPLLLILAPVLFSACESTVAEQYVPEQTAFSFSSKKLTFDYNGTDAQEIQVQLNRTDLSGEVELPVSIAYAKGATKRDSAFQLSSPKVSFLSGKGNASAVVTFDTKDMDFSGYKFILVFAKELKSPSGIDSITVSFSRQLTWDSIGMATFTSDFFGESWPQKIERAQEAPLYRLKDCYAANYNITFLLGDDGTITFDKQETGYIHPDYGMVSMQRSASIPSVKKGNTITLGGRFTVSAGSFGDYPEVIDLAD